MVLFYFNLFKYFNISSKNSLRKTIERRCSLSFLSFLFSKSSGYRTIFVQKICTKIFAQLRNPSSLSFAFFANNGENSNVVFTFFLIGGGVLGLSLVGWGLKSYFSQKIDNRFQMTHLSREYAQGFSHQKIWQKPSTFSSLEFKKEKIEDLDALVMTIFSNDEMEKYLDQYFFEESLYSDLELETKKAHVLSIINHLKMKHFEAKDVLNRNFSEIDLTVLTSEKRNEFFSKIEYFSRNFAYYLKSYLRKNENLEFLLKKETYDSDNPRSTFLHDFVERIFRKSLMGEETFSKEDFERYFIRGFVEGIEQDRVMTLPSYEMTLTEQTYSMGSIFPSLVKTILDSEAPFCSVTSQTGKDHQELVFLILIDQLILVLQNFIS